ncbi:hypothetical protein ACJ3XI_06695 [Litorimonas sp. RW-G-Af-16]|uniref:hypothetical protein n=1 Tax=Litorimonas sp. RW-G-Af-16 TaxID=3241168 RepID=UPI00390CACC5
MSNTYRLPGNRGGLLGQLTRVFFLAVAAVGGIFMLAFSAAFALFAVAGIALLGFLAFCVFWVRAKILGRPFGPKAQFEAARRDMEAQFHGMDLNMEQNGPRENGDGPIIDAHRTPDGWSVDD